MVSGSWLCFGGQTRREGKTAAQRYLASEAFPTSFIQGTQHGGTVSQFKVVPSEPEHNKIYNKIFCSMMNFNVLVIDTVDSLHLLH